MEKLIIFPYNGNGLEALDCIGGKYDFIGFIDDTPEKQGKRGTYEVFGRKFLDKHPTAKILAVPGSPKNYTVRHQFIESLGVERSRFTTLIHPRASVSPLANIGFNVLIMAGVVITANAVIGNNVCILPNSVIHHDSVVGDNTLIGSNVTVAGFTKIGRSCYIGSGSSIINNIEIGNFSLVGMGTNVIKTFPENSKIVGNPGRNI